MSVSQIAVLTVVAVADIARSVWVMIAVMDTGRGTTVAPWLAATLIVATGLLSVALLGLVLRAVLEQRHQAAPLLQAPSS